jgi:hypothetical protein
MKKINRNSKKYEEKKLKSRIRIGTALRKNPKSPKCPDPDLQDP